ncbi:hypothetical protein [Paenibacillus sp. GYB003]|uniref:hypothetical protein n=1 Tax=Paenibacillus sp. GYB003 TaxID=2994392 RepID=UPI002F9664FE
MPAQLSWGPFTIQTGLLAVIAAAVAAIFAVRLLSRLYGAAAKEAADYWQNAAFIVMLVWKFGHVLFAPAVVWQRPLALIVMNGGTRELLLAVAAAAVYVLAKIRRGRLPLPLFLDLSAFGAVAAVFVYACIDRETGAATSLPWGLTVSDPEYRYHPVSAYSMIVAAVVAALLWMRRGAAGSGELARIASLYMGAGMLLVSFWDVPAPTYWLLSAFQWRALALAAVGIIFSARVHNKGERS